MRVELSRAIPARSDPNLILVRSDPSLRRGTSRAAAPSSAKRRYVGPLTQRRLQLPGSEADRRRLHWRDVHRLRFHRRGGHRAHDRDGPGPASGDGADPARGMTLSALSPQITSLCARAERDRPTARARKAVGSGGIEPDRGKIVRMSRVVQSKFSVFRVSD